MDHYVEICMVQSSRDCSQEGWLNSSLLRLQSLFHKSTLYQGYSLHWTILEVVYCFLFWIKVAHITKGESVRIHDARQHSLYAMGIVGVGTDSIRVNECTGNLPKAHGRIVQ